MIAIIDKFFETYNSIFDPIFMTIFGISPDSPGGVAIIGILGVSFFALGIYCDRYIKSLDENAEEESPK